MLVMLVIPLWHEWINPITDTPTIHTSNCALLLIIDLTYKTTGLFCLFLNTRTQSYRESHSWRPHLKRVSWSLSFLHFSLRPSPSFQEWTKHFMFNDWLALFISSPAGVFCCSIFLLCSLPVTWRWWQSSTSGNVQNNSKWRALERAISNTFRAFRSLCLFLAPQLKYTRPILM